MTSVRFSNPDSVTRMLSSILGFVSFGSHILKSQIINLPNTTDIPVLIKYLRVNELVVLRVLQVRIDNELAKVDLITLV